MPAPFNPQTQRPVSPKEKAAVRAERLRFLYWAAVALPLIVTVMLYGYTEQAPRWLYNLTVQVDAVFGQPVLWLIRLAIGAG